jgi:2'-5' RNA ligase
MTGVRVCGCRAALDNQRMDPSSAGAGTATPAGRGASRRLFFAVLPDDGARTGVDALARAVAQATGGRAPPASNLHLTLAFLGAVTAAREARLAAIGAHCARSAAPFSFVLDRLGHFRGARVAYAAPPAVPGPLARIVLCLQGELRNAGLPVEDRAFAPHVTLARRATRAPGPGPIAPIAWHVDALALMASEPSPDGVRYRVLDAWHLSPVAAG